MTREKIEIEDRKPEEIIKPKFIDTYKSFHEDIWHRLIHLNTTITIMERIASYPIDHLYSPHNFPHSHVFLEMVYWNFTYSGIVMLYTLTGDTSKKNPLTLQYFKNNLIKIWLNESEKKAFAIRLKKAHFCDRFKKLNHRICDMRNKVIAHRDLQNFAGGQNIPGISIPDIRFVYDEVERLFLACTFGGEFVTTLYPPLLHHRKPVQKDIDYIMELWLQNSPWLRTPERRDEFWHLERNYKTPEFIEELNHWRKIFGLPEA